MGARISITPQHAISYISDWLRPASLATTPNNLRMSKLQRLEDYLQKHHPHIRYATPTSAEYEDLRKAYIIDNPAVPLAIVRPQSAEDAASLVRYAVSADIEINVRTGGHDPHGRCFVQDALAIDMRDIAFVRVADDKSSANIGGGVLTGDLIESLATHKLATALCTIPSVGFVGWATHGGYGPLAGCFGLGADQILGAKVVNCRGEIVEADSEMLLAIRGAGGTLGIIVELTIKTHPLDKVKCASQQLRFDRILELIMDRFLQVRSCSSRKTWGRLYKTLS